MVRRYCDKCGQDITYYKDFIVKMNVETIATKIEYLEEEDKNFDLCSECWEMIESCIERGMENDE